MELQDRMEVALDELRVLAALLDPEEPLPLKDRERLGMMLARHLDDHCGRHCGIAHHQREGVTYEPQLRHTCPASLPNSRPSLTCWSCLGRSSPARLTEDCVVPFGAADYLAAQCDAASSTLRHLASEMHHHAQQADA